MKEQNASSSVFYITEGENPLTISKDLLKTEPSVVSNIFVTPDGKIISSGSCSQKRVEQKVISKKIIQSIFIAGEEFIITFENNEVILTHSKWSLTGNGTDLHIAEINLLENAKIYFEGYHSIPLNELSQEAIKFRDFLFSLI